MAQAGVALQMERVAWEESEEKEGGPEIMQIQYCSEILGKKHANFKERVNDIGRG